MKTIKYYLKKEVYWRILFWSTLGSIFWVIGYLIYNCNPKYLWSPLTPFYYAYAYKKGIGIIILTVILAIIMEIKDRLKIKKESSKAKFNLNTNQLKCSKCGTISDKTIIYNNDPICIKCKPNSSLNESLELQEAANVFKNIAKTNKSKED